MTNFLSPNKDFNKVDISFMLIEVNLRDYSMSELDLYLAEMGFKNIACLSNFTHENTPEWEGTHNDYLYQKTW